MTVAVLTPEDIADWTVANGLGDQINHYIRLLQQGSAQQNLVGSKDPVRIKVEFVYDSIASWLLADMAGKPFTDVGSGAGLPGIVWALCNKATGCDVEAVLVEPRAGRVAFLRETIKQFGLPIKVLKAHLKDAIATPGDLTSRAVFRPSELLVEMAPYAEQRIIIHATQEPAALHGWELELAGRFVVGPEVARAVYVAART